jgi:4-amino-4-deoxy-L-arabinose transferase-like glycosyltransferase
LLALGVAWRLLRYFLQFPIWGDEAFVCLNFLDHDYVGLTRPLRYVQVAPMLFLWSELAAYRLFGGSELALRLLPALAGLGSLLLFWRLTRLTLPPLAGAIAIGFLAVAYYPVRHSCEVKPYAFDLFFSLALLVAAVSWLRRPKRMRWLLLLIACVPLALGLSYPAVFVAGAAGLALLPVVWRLREGATWALYVTYNGVILASFLGVYLLAGTSQYDSTGGTQNFYWTEWFPPAQPLAFLKWLVLAHSGNMMAYPAGGKDGASAVTFLLCATAIYHFVRARRLELLILLLGPFALTFVAAALHRYPYGGSARVAQHLAPAICFLAGTGAAVWLAALARRMGDIRRPGLGVCAVLALVGFVGIVRDWKKPYKTDGDETVRQIVAEVAKQAGSKDQIVVMDVDTYIGATFEWYLRRQGNRVRWDGHADWSRLCQHGELWGFSFSRDGAGRALFEKRFQEMAPPMLLVGHNTYDLQLGQSDDTIAHCEVFHWKGMYGD